jgi:DNA modification methylase/ParB-like chromosome segregation protein Spo0J
MRQIPITDILIKPERQRQEFDPQALQELVSSIEENGLMHPPVLRSEAGQWVLVAGERRLKAVSQIWELGGKFRHDNQEVDEGCIPFTNIGELSVLQAEEAELDENLKRKDLTWQEHAAAVARLHKLRIAQRAETAAKEIDPEVRALIKEHTIADTAEELTGRRDGDYQAQTRKEILVSRHLDNPLVAKAKSADEAFKILKRQEESAKNVELARVVGATFNADLHQLLNVNCLEFMASVADGPEEKKFDVILTDPPYGMGADNFGDAGGKLSGIEHHYDDSYESWKDLMGLWTDLSFKVAKAQAHAYVFCDIDMFHELKALMQKAGWYVFRTPLINHKTNSGRVPLPDQGPRRQYEIILYAIKGKKQTTHIYPDVISTSADENFSHGAQKPVALYQNLLQRSVRPGDRVLDSFAGSGTIFEAANGFKVAATGTELNPEYYGMCLARLRRLKALETPALF